MPESSTDRQLLFGVLAYQLEFVDRSELISALSTWIDQKQVSVGELLVRRGAISAEDRDLLEPMVTRHVEKHGGRAEESLKSISSASSIRSALARLRDADLEQSVAHLPSEGTPHLEATESFDPGATRHASRRFRIVRFHAQGGLGKISVAIDDELH